MLKNIGRVLGYGILNILILLTLVAGTLFLSFSAPNVKTWLSSSGIYNDATYTTLSSDYIDALDVGVDKSVLATEFNKAFPPSFVQQSSETIVDSTFAWLNGQTKTVDFTIDISTQKDQFAKGVADYAVKRYQALPACPGRTLPKTTDPLKIECRVPAGLLNIEAEAVKYTAALKNNPGYFPENVITPSTFDTAHTDSNPLSNNQIPLVYQRARLVPIAFLILLVIIYIWWGALSKNRRMFFTRASIHMVFTSIGIAAVFSFGTTSLRAIQEQALKQTELNTQLRTSVLNLFDTAMQTWTKNIYIASAIMAGASLIVLAILYFTREKPSKTITPETDTASIEEMKRNERVKKEAKGNDQ